MATTTQLGTNMVSVRNHNIFAANNANAEKAMTRATTGLKIASAQDGPSQWQISEKMRERINSLNQADQNVQNDNNMMKTAENGINSIIDIVRTLKARAVEAGNADTTDDDRQALAKEIKSLFEQITYTATETRYNNKLLLASPATGQIDTGTANSASSGTITLTFQVGDSTTGNFDVTVKNMTLAGLGLNSYSTSISNLATAANSGTVGILSPASGGSLTTFMNALDTALDTALNAATDIGAYQQRLGYIADNVSTQIENLQASDSTIRESDVAHEITEYMKFSVLSQASQYMLAQSNQNAFQVLNLLQ